MLGVVELPRPSRSLDFDSRLCHSLEYVHSLRIRSVSTKVKEWERNPTSNLFGMYFNEGIQFLKAFHCCKVDSII